MRNAERLCLAHFWVAFAAFLAACILGTWQMWVRSPFGAKVGTPELYFMSVTAHGVSMAYVLTTLFIMGFGYFVAVTSLARPLPGKAWAWGAFWLAIIGVVLMAVPIAMTAKVARERYHTSLLVKSQMARILTNTLPTIMTT